MAMLSGQAGCRRPRCYNINLRVSAVRRRHLLPIQSRLFVIPEQGSGLFQGHVDTSHVTANAGSGRPNTPPGSRANGPGKDHGWAVGVPSIAGPEAQERSKAPRGVEVGSTVQYVGAGIRRRANRPWHRRRPSELAAGYVNCSSGGRPGRRVGSDQSGSSLR